MNSPRAVKFVDHQQRAPAAVVGPPAVRRQPATLALLVLCLEYVDHGMTVTAINRRALGHLVLLVDSDALGELAQRRGSCPFGGEQKPTAHK